MLKMPPVWEDRKYTAKDSKSSQCDHVTDKTKRTNGKSLSPLESTNHTNTSGQPHKLAHDDKGMECVNTNKQSMKFTNGKEVERADYLDSQVPPVSDKYDLKSLMHQNKIRKQELTTEKEADPESQHLEDEKTGGYLDNKTTDVPTELEGAYAYKKDIRDVNRHSEDDETRANKKADSGDEHDDHEDTADTTNESVTPEPAYDPLLQATQRSHTSEEDSVMPIVEPTECNTISTDKAKFVISVAKAPFIQLHEPAAYQPAAETKLSDYLLPNHRTTSYLLLDTTSLLLNNKLLDNVSSEEQVIVLPVNQLLKHPENEAGRLDTSDTSALLTVDKLQVGGSVYPYFSALAGPAGENPEELSNESSELHVQNYVNDDDDTTLVGSVSDHTSFQSGFSDTFDSNTQAFSFGKIHL